MAKYAVVVDHTSNNNKSFTYIKLSNTNKAEAFAEGSCKGFSVDNVYCIHIIKQISKYKWQSIVRVYQGGCVENLKATNNSGWGMDYSYWELYDYDFTEFKTK